MPVDVEVTDDEMSITLRMRALVIQPYISKKDEMSEALSVLPVVAAISGALVTGVITVLTVLITNKGNNRRLDIQHSFELTKLRKDRLTTKGEELYSLLTRWEENFGARFVSLHSVMKNSLTYDDALDLQARQVKEIDHEKIHMTIAVYFQNLQPYYDAVLKLREPVQNIADAHKEAYKRGEADGRNFPKLFTAANLALISAIDALKRALVEEIRAI